VVATFGSGKMRKLKGEKKKTPATLSEKHPPTHVVGTMIKEFQKSI